MIARIVSWLDERVDLRGIYRGLFDRPVPSGLTWWHTLGSATLTAFMVQVTTGIVLATFFSASPDHAYDSVRYIEQHVLLGGFLRGLHTWGASAMVVLAMAHMLRVFSMGAYKYPREANWLVGVGLLALVIGFGFTGYLLPWDQKAYWGTQVGTSIAGTAPVIGPFIAIVLKGGTQLGAATLSRFYAVHVLWLPILLGTLVAVHLAFVIRQGIAAPPRMLEAGAPERTSGHDYPPFYRRAYADSKRGVRFWPDIVGKDLIVSLGLVLVLALLAWARGAGLEPPADPTDSTYVPRPEWYFLPFFQFLKLFPGSLESTVAVGVPLLGFIAVIGLPFYDRRSTRNLLRRPVALTSVSLLLAGSAMLLGLAVREFPPASGAPAGAPLAVSERAGRAMFERQCASCHVVGGKGGDKGPDLSEVGLKHSASWLHSFIEAPLRFHPESEMPGFGPPVLTHQEVEEVARYVATLRGAPGATRQPEFVDTFPQLIAPEKSAPAASRTAAKGPQ